MLVQHRGGGASKDAEAFNSLFEMRELCIVVSILEAQAGAFNSLFEMPTSAAAGFAGRFSALSILYLRCGGCGSQARSTA